MPFCCPVCEKTLYSEGNSLYCKTGHCFDRAKSGYVNLLPAHMAHSKTPGDNRRMVETRKAFLEAGYYVRLRDSLCQKVSAFAAEKTGGRLVLLDAGCGEGYYTEGMAQTLLKRGRPFEAMGLDISKWAVNLAAKRTKHASFAVGSIFHLPLAENSCDIVTEIFAPFCRDEYYRVLKSGELLILVIPAPRHLWELKQAVYQNPYPNKTKPYEIEGFSLLYQEPVEFQITLDCPEDIQNLFQMTPYAYKTSKEDTGRMLELNTLKTTAGFYILGYRACK